jgi:hypothetical protein
MENSAFVPELWERPISIFEKANSVIPLGELRLIDLMGCLNGNLREDICSPEILSLMQTAKVTAEQILNEIDKSRLQNLKRLMPAFTPHGSLRTRASYTQDKSFLASGWVQIDVDGKDNPSCSPVELKERVSAWPFVGYCGYSVSGKGVWALAPTTVTLATTSTYIYQFAQKEGVNIDSSKGKANTELRFISFDPDPYFNYTPTMILPHQVEPRSIPRIKRTTHPVSSSSKDEVTITLLELLNSAPEGSRHAQRLATGRLAGRYVKEGLFSEDEVKTILTEDYHTNFPNDSPSIQKKEIKSISDGIKYGLNSSQNLNELAYAIEADLLEYNGELVKLTQNGSDYTIEMDKILEKKPHLIYIRASNYYELEHRPRIRKHFTKKISPN